MIKDSQWQSFTELPQNLCWTSDRWYINNDRKIRMLWYEYHALCFNPMSMIVKFSINSEIKLGKRQFSDNQRGFLLLAANVSLQSSLLVIFTKFFDKNVSLVFEFYSLSLRTHRRKFVTMKMYSYSNLSPFCQILQFLPS